MAFSNITFELKINPDLPILSITWLSILGTFLLLISAFKNQMGSLKMYSPLKKLSSYFHQSTTISSYFCASLVHRFQHPYYYAIQMQR